MTVAQAQAFAKKTGDQSTAGEQDEIQLARILLRNSCALAEQLCLYSARIDIRKVTPGFHGHGSRNPRTLPCNGAAHHVAHSSVAHLVPANDPTGRQQMLHPPGDH